MSVVKEIIRYLMGWRKVKVPMPLNPEDHIIVAMYEYGEWEIAEVEFLPYGEISLQDFVETGEYGFAYPDGPSIDAKTIKYWRKMPRFF